MFVLAFSSWSIDVSLPQCCILLTANNGITMSSSPTLETWSYIFLADMNKMLLVVISWLLIKWNLHFFSENVVCQ